MVSFLRVILFNLSYQPDEHHTLGPLSNGNQHVATAASTQGIYCPLYTPIF